MAITGNNTTGGKDGVFVGDDPTSSITISNNVFRNPVCGVRVYCTWENRAVNGIVISGNSVAGATDCGIRVEEGSTGQLARVTITGNNIDISGAGKQGIRIIKAELVRVIGNQVMRCREDGIFIDGVDIVELTGNTVQDAGISGVFDAVRAVNSNRVIMRDTIVYGTARYAVNITGGVGMTVTGTRWRSISPGGVVAPSGTVQSDNAVFNL